ncbi:serine carboxypeptidase II-1-like, partial [Olea europaea var. sylvestris]
YYQVFEALAVSLLELSNAWPEGLFVNGLIPGESYAGDYVSQLSQIILERNKVIQHPISSFKESMVWNAVINDYHDYIGTFQYWWTPGLISNSTYKVLRVTGNFGSATHPTSECVKAFALAGKKQGNIDHIACTPSLSMIHLHLSAD